jgi:acyl-CoA thioesterase I
MLVIKYSVFFFLALLLLNFSVVAETSSTSSLKSEIKKIVILGDSLTEGLGVAQSSAFPALVQKMVDEKKMNWKVISSGSSGSTSASGPSRIKWIVNPKNKDRPDLILLLLGSNDGLRGLKPEDTKRNLKQTIQLAEKEKIKVILGQLYMPPNYGKDYTEKFAKIFPEIAKENKIPLAGFLLDGVAGKASLNLADGIHPNEKGHVKVAENVFREIEKFLK